MLKVFFVFFFCLSLPLHVQAIGFGQAKLHSHMGEPLQVQVPLLLADGEDIQTFKVVLASPQDYSRLEQLLPKSYLSIRLDVDAKSPTSPVITISSIKAIDEAMLTLLVKIKRGRGSFYKKIQLFLEAAPHSQVKKSSVWKKESVSRISFTKPIAQTSPTPLLQDSLQPRHSTHDTNWARRDSYGPVQSGDSISVIAYRLRKNKRWKNQDIVWALFQKNPEAFYKNDPSQLKKGAFLTVPSTSEVQAYLKNAQNTLPQSITTNPITPPVPQVTKTNTKPLSYYGKISLGLTEKKTSQKSNDLLQQHLKRLEPLFQRSVKTELQMDTLHEQVGTLATKIDLLSRKVDQLNKPPSQPEDTNYGWLAFLLLCILNVLAISIYLYRRQMSRWQQQLIDAQRANAPPPADDTSTAPSIEPNFGVSTTHLSKLAHDPVNQQRRDEASPNLQLQYHDQSSVKLNDDDIDAIVEPIEHAHMFEESVHKQDWNAANHHYSQMNVEECNKIRTQALLVEKMHGEADILGRNIMLLTLFKQYSKNDWHRFSALFSEDIWQALEDDNIINFKGDVMEEEGEHTTDAVADLPFEHDTVEINGDTIDFSGKVMDDISIDDYAIEGDPLPNIPTANDTEETLPEHGEMSSYPKASGELDDSFELDFSGLDINHFQPDKDSSEETESGSSDMIDTEKKVHTPSSQT